MRCLVLVDIQNDFLPGGALAAPQGDRILPVVNRLQTHFDLVVATKDWHPADHGSFAKTHGRKVGEVIDLNGVSQILWPVHCVQGSAGAEFPPGLDQDRIQKVFEKGTDKGVDSYSAFFDNAKKRSTGLGEYLNAEGVDEVYVVGLVTDVCVKFSALDAQELGFKTHVVVDGCCPINLKPGDEERALQELRRAGVKVMTSQELQT